ncbi:MAG: hypothetical protein H6728_02580 [Myxococcales bacterium]|nr:hypothetical protein [Myxococcales bacterium]
MVSQITSRRTRSPYFDATDVILGLLQSSPLVMWVNPESFSKYLERRLPEYVKDGVLDLEPIWQSISRIPGVQKQAMDTFFVEIQRQPLPWPVRAPHVMGGSTRVAIDEDKLQRGIDQMVTLMESSTLKSSLPPERYRRYLERRLPEMIDIDGIDLTPLETALGKSLNCDPESLDAYFRRLRRFALPWPIKAAAPTKPNNAYGTSADLRTTPPQQKLRQTPQTGIPRASSEVMPLSRTQANLQVAQKRANAAALKQTTDILVRLMESSPLSVYLRADNFQRYLQRWLPEYTSEGFLETQPIWEHLSRIPSLKPNILLSFFNELLRQELPFPIQPPKDFDALRRRHATSASLQSFQGNPARHYEETVAEPPAAEEQSGWTKNSSYDSVLQALENEFQDFDLDSIEVVQSAQGNTQRSHDLVNKPSSSHQNKRPPNQRPQGDAKAAKGKSASSYALLDATQDQDAYGNLLFDAPASIRKSKTSIALPTIDDIRQQARNLGSKAYLWNWQRIAVVSWASLGILFLLLGMWWVAQPIKLGEAISPGPYTRFVPAQQAYLNGAYMTFALDPFYQHLWEAKTLKEQCDKMNEMLYRKEVRRLRIYTTRNNKPYKLLLTCKIYRPSKPKPTPRP